MSGGPTILGIDGGGSKTLAALADQSGTIIRTAQAGGVNPMDNPRWHDELMSVLNAFRDEPDLGAVALAIPVFGEVASLSEAQQEAVASVFGGLPQMVLNDVDSAHRGAFAGGAGILILSGTGSMAWARDAAGRSFRVGGWGDLIGDEGSSYWIGLRVLSLISQSIDGRAPPSTLVDAVFDALGLDRADPLNALEGWVTHLPHARSGIATLARLATQEAEAGDAASIALVEQAAGELARHVTTIAAQANLPLDWSFAGGTFASGGLQNAVTRAVGRAPRPAILPPIGGALLSAAQLIGWPTNAAWINRLANSIQNQTASSPTGSGDRNQYSNQETGNA